MDSDGSGDAARVHAEQDTRLVALLRALRRKDYRFVTPTPATHARIVARSDRQDARTLDDVLGWSMPYRPGVLDAEIEGLLDAAGQIEQVGDRRRATVRVSSLGEQLFLHSAYPTTEERAVFFGPDSYRFADLIRQELSKCPQRHGAQMVDIGTGSGVGGIVAASACPGLTVHLTDINPQALRCARINAEAAGVAVTTIESATVDDVPGAIDIATANPPYIIDADSRMYRDGGDMHGGRVSLDMARMAVARLAPEGRLILYTGSAIVRGLDPLRIALTDTAREYGAAITYRELDPDVFGEELEEDAYRDVDRIALVACVITRGR